MQIGFWMMRGMLSAIMLSLLLVFYSVVLAGVLFLEKGLGRFNVCAERLRLAAVRFFKPMWIHCIAAYIHLIAPSTFVVTSGCSNMGGKLINLRQRGWFWEDGETDTGISLLVSNHQIYYDWMYIWYYLYRVGRASELCIVLKESLRRMPIVGLTMELSDFVFLKRSWASDEAYLSQRIPEIRERGRVSLLIFPEGTVIEETTLDAAQKYARDRGYEEFGHVLVPRSTGLFHVIRNIDENFKLYDLTIGYMPFTEETPYTYYGIADLFLSGRRPERVYFHINEYEKRNIPLESKERFSEWLHGLFSEKDARLKALHTDRKPFEGHVLYEGPMDVPYYLLTLTGMAMHAVGWIAAVTGIVMYFRQ